jgi:hypothetical protein
VNAVWTGPAVTILSALAVVTVIAAGRAEACAICLSAVSVTTGQKLDAADQVVLAMPLPDGKRFRIVEVVKGEAAVDGIIAEHVDSVDAAALRSDKPLVLLRNELGQRWANIGGIDAAYAGWLRRLAALKSTGPARPNAIWPRTALPSSAEPTDAEWRERLALVVPNLEDPEPLVAEIAHGEVARAPYSAIRSIKAQLDASAIARWLEAPKPARRATYTLLLGIAGGRDDAARLAQRLDAAWQARDAANLAAMLGADLELRGPSRVAWIEQRYFADRTRTMPEIEAALLALGVHGRANAAIPRERVIAAYRFFITERKPMAGFVALQLADWEHWDATADYVALLKTDAVKDPASHFAVVSYLQRSPRAEAKTALRSLAGQSR